MVVIRQSSRVLAQTRSWIEGAYISVSTGLAKLKGCLDAQKCDSDNVFKG